MLNNPADREIGFLKTQYSPEWQAELSEFDRYAADIAVRAKAAGIPLIVTFAPNRPQAAMVSLGEWPPGFDPYILDTQLRETITRLGGTYVDILPDFRKLPGAERLYYPMDGPPHA
ncbi:MAG: hypothetical protein WDM77_03570 [Steroidobacteraceae bacterium]